MQQGVNNNTVSNNKNKFNESNCIDDLIGGGQSENNSTSIPKYKYF